MKDELHGKYEKLKENLREMRSVAVAFSGGVDSTFLLKTAHDVLGDKAIAVTAVSASFPQRELAESRLLPALPHAFHTVKPSHGTSSPWWKRQRISC